MTGKKIEFRKKRELGEILSDSFDFIKQEYKPIAQLLIRYVVPFLILYGIAQVYFQINVLRNIDLTDPESMMGNIGPIYSNIFLFSLFGIFVQSLLISTLYSYIEIYIKTDGNFDLSELTPNLFSNGLLVLGASLLYSIIFMFGLFLFIIPGFYFANTFSLTVIALIIEKKGIGNAFTSSWSLVNKSWWGTFAVILIGIIIVWVGGFVLSLIPLSIGFNTAVNNNTEPSLNYWIVMVIVSTISSLLWIIPYTFIAFQYFNLKERLQPTLPQF